MPKRIRRYAGIHRAWHQIRVIQLSVRQLRLAGFQQAVRVAQASALDSSRSVWISGFTGPELVVHTLTFGGNSITSGRDIYRVGCALVEAPFVELAWNFSLKPVPTRDGGERERERENSAKHSPGFGPSPSIWWW